MEDEIAQNDDELARFPRKFVKIVAIIATCWVLIEIGSGLFCFAFDKPYHMMLPTLIPSDFFGGAGAQIFFVMYGIGGPGGAFLFWLFSFLLAPSLYKPFMAFAPRRFTEAQAKVAAQSVFMSLAIFEAFYALAGIVTGIFYYCCLDHRPAPNDLFNPAGPSGNGKLVLAVSVAALAVGILIFCKCANAAVTRLVAKERARQPAPGGDAPATGGEAAPAGEGGAGGQA